MLPNCCCSVVRRFATKLVAACFLLLAVLLAPGVGYATPANDNFAHAIRITGTATFTGNNVNATTEANEPSFSSNAGGRTVWWTWTAPADQTVVISTDGSSFDTMLAVYTGDSLESLALETWNDDANGLTSMVSFQAVAGTVYHIVVDGYGTENGSVSIAVRHGSATVTASVYPANAGTVSGAGQFTVGDDVELIAQPNPGYGFVNWTEAGNWVSSDADYIFTTFGDHHLVANFAQIPANDDFAAAVTVSGTAVSVHGSNFAATKEYGEPDHPDDSGGASVWWSWTAPVDGPVVVSTAGSTFETLLAVYTGNSVDSLTEVATEDQDSGPTSMVTFYATAGETYAIAVDGYSGAAGSIALGLKVLSGTRQINVTETPTGAGTTTGGGTYDAGAFATVSASANDGYYFLSWKESGTTVSHDADYTFLVLENRSLVAKFVPPATNDNFANATVLQGRSVSVEGNNFECTKEPGEPDHAGISGGASAWWSWTAPANGPVTITTAGSDQDTVLGVYTGASVDALTEVASDDDSGGELTSTVEFTATAGVTYRIAVDGYSGGTGPVQLQLSYGGVEQQNGPKGGRFVAMITDPDASHPGSGVVDLRLKHDRHFTAKCVYGGHIVHLHGHFNRNGQWSGKLSGWAVRLNLQLDPNDSNALAGTVTVNGTVLSDIHGGRAIQGRAPQAGRYTALLTSGSAVSVPLPEGNGWATLHIRRSGDAIIKGRLGDGTPFMSRSILTSDGMLPLYVRLNSGAGSLAGWLEFSDLENSDIDGTLTWHKPARRTNQTYRDGFDGEVSVIGSRFSRPTAMTPLLDLPYGTANVDLTSTDLGTALSQTVALSDGGHVMVLPPNDSDFSISIVPENGIVFGSYLDQDTQHRHRFSGVILQKQNVAGGFFLDQQETGVMSLSPVVP